MPDVNGISVRREWITLSEPCRMISDYECRGIPAKEKTFPAGTAAFYETFPYNGAYAARAGDPITHWDHIVTVRDGRVTYRSTKRVPIAEEVA